MYSLTSACLQFLLLCFGFNNYFFIYLLCIQESFTNEAFFNNDALLVFLYVMSPVLVFRVKNNVSGMLVMTQITIKPDLPEFSILYLSVPFLAVVFRKCMYSCVKNSSVFLWSLCLSSAKKWTAFFHLFNTKKNFRPKWQLEFWQNCRDISSKGAVLSRA